MRGCFLAASRMRGRRGMLCSRWMSLGGHSQDARAADDQCCRHENMGRYEVFLFSGHSGTREDREVRHSFFIFVTNKTILPDNSLKCSAAYLLSNLSIVQRAMRECGQFITADN